MPRAILTLAALLAASTADAARVVVSDVRVLPGAVAIATIDVEPTRDGELFSNAAIRVRAHNLDGTEVLPIMLTGDEFDGSVLQLGGWSNKVRPFADGSIQFVQSINGDPFFTPASGHLATITFDVSTVLDSHFIVTPAYLDNASAVVTADGQRFFALPVEWVDATFAAAKTPGPVPQVFEPHGSALAMVASLAALLFRRRTRVNVDNEQRRLGLVAAVVIGVVVVAGILFSWMGIDLR